MTNRVALIDYGAGNMFSIENALRSVAGDVSTVTDEDEWHELDPNVVVLPGVGAFGKGMEALGRRGLTTLLVEHSAGGRPLLGICLGAQLLLSSSSEFGRHTGLDVIEGSAEPFDESIVRVPHIGWAQIHESRASPCPLLDGIPNGAWMYFVHSFHLQPSHERDVLATTQLGSTSFTSAIEHGRTFGVQFHPEKSGPLGLRILHNFVNLEVTS